MIKYFEPPVSEAERLHENESASAVDARSKAEAHSRMSIVPLPTHYCSVINNNTDINTYDVLIVLRL